MNPEQIALANMIYGEEAKGNMEVMKMIGSTALNRLESGKVDEFGGDLNEVLQKGYFAVSNQNDPYQWASSGKFPDKVSENNYKKALQVAGGLLSGRIERVPGLFYMTDKELKKKMKPDSDFDLSLVEEVGKSGKYTVMDYAKKKKKKGMGNITRDINTSFGKAFKEARKAGKETFEWNGDKYTTEMK